MMAGAAERASRRQFHLIDGMILIAAIGCGIAATRWQFDHQPYAMSWWGGNAWNAGIWAALILSAALAAIRLRSGRSGRRRAVRPGFAACVAPVAALLVLIAHELTMSGFFLLRSIVLPTSGWKELADHILNLLQMNAPCAVASTWLLLALTGRWRCGRDWIDWAGIAMGVYWITWPMMTWVVALGG